MPTVLVFDTSWDEYWNGWEKCLNERTQEKKQLKEGHNKLVAKLVSHGEGAAGSLHKVTKSTLWRGCIQTLQEVHDGADPLKRVEDKRPKWNRH